MRGACLAGIFTIQLLMVGSLEAKPSDNATQKLGFLLALKEPNCTEGNLCNGKFQTLLLVIEGDKMRVAVKAPHLYVPRKSGFWEVGIIWPSDLSTERPNSSEKADDNEGKQSAEPIWLVWAAPIGTKPNFPKLTAEEANQVEDSGDEPLWFSMGWVGSNYLSVTEQIGEYKNTSMILSIDRIAENAPELPWTPNVPGSVLQRDLDGCVDENSDFNTRDFLDGAEQQWSICRGKMRWEFTWGFGYSGGASRGYSTACATSLRPPRELVGNELGGFGWNQVLARVPDAQTAFASPDQSVVLVFSGTQVLALKRERGTLSAPFARVFLTGLDGILAGQWAMGKYADIWAERLSHAKSWVDKIGSNAN